MQRFLLDDNERAVMLSLLPNFAKKKITNEKRLPKKRAKKRFPTSGWMQRFLLEDSERAVMLALLPVSFAM